MHFPTFFKFCHLSLEGFLCGSSHSKTSRISLIFSLPWYYTDNCKRLYMTSHHHTSHPLGYLVWESWRKIVSQSLHIIMALCMFTPFTEDGLSFTCCDANQNPFPVSLLHTQTLLLCVFTPLVARLYRRRFFYDYLSRVVMLTRTHFLCHYFT